MVNSSKMEKIKEKMMWVVYAVMTVITLNSAIAITFYDDFENGVIDHNWSVNPDVLEQDGFLIFGSNGGSVYQNFSETMGIDLSQAFTIKWNMTNIEGINTAYSSIYLNDGAGNYVFLSPNYDSTDSFVNDDLIIYCGGTCSCTQVTNLSTPEQPAYEATITYNPLTNTLRLERNDSISLENVVTGCTFSETNVQAFGRDGSVNISDFFIEGLPFCYPNWTCGGYAACLPNSTQYCNVAVDNNSCGDSYTGDYSEFLPQSCVLNVTGYQAQYNTGDFVNIASNGLGTAGATLVSMIAIIVIGGLIVYGYNQYKRAK